LNQVSKKKNGKIKNNGIKIKIEMIDVEVEVGVGMEVVEVVEVVDGLCR
jgi:hypothetical protein